MTSTAPAILDPLREAPVYSPRMSRLVSVFLAVCLSATARATSPSVRVVRFETDINGASAKRILEAIDAADAAGDALVLIELDTPGGSVETSTKGSSA